MGAASLASVAILAALVDVAPSPNGEALDLVAVRDQARKLRTTLPKGETIEIRFAPGEYFVTNTVSLYKADGNVVINTYIDGTLVYVVDSTLTGESKIDNIPHSHRMYFPYVNDGSAKPLTAVEKMYVQTYSSRSIAIFIDSYTITQEITES